MTGPAWHILHHSSGLGHPTSTAGPGVSQQLTESGKSGCSVVATSRECHHHLANNLNAILELLDRHVIEVAWVEYKETVLVSSTAAFP